MKKVFLAPDGTPIKGVSYSDFLKSIFLKYVPNKKVLELGGSAGVHTNIVRDYNPEILFTVDPHIRHDPGGDITPDFYGTANDYYKQAANPEFDVVLCMGLLYHLHSPFHLLEQIVNLSKPKVLIVESLRKIESTAYPEIDWAETGNAHSDVGIEYPLHINYGPTGGEFIMALETTPMKLYKFYDYDRKYEDYAELVPIDDWFVKTSAGVANMEHKKDMWMAIFTKNGKDY